MGILLCSALACRNQKEQQDPELAGFSKGHELAVIETRFGKIYLDFYKKDAPRHTENFRKLVQEKFFDGTLFHRVVPGFVIQGGDPLSRDEDRGNDGSGGPGYTLAPEIKQLHRRGSVGAARLSDDVNPRRNSSGSQFYICLNPLPRLDHNYTVFARVVKGMDVVDSVAHLKRDPGDNPLEKVEMKVYLIKL
ncbi:MAG: peptidylprolyl isomerase [Candidatus Delongbacteria bacterium]|nr:peptidylprolyl isomerase [Candidatus Delongbacteria bacterium]